MYNACISWKLIISSLARYLVLPVFLVLILINFVACFKSLWPEVFVAYLCVTCSRTCSIVVVPGFLIFRPGDYKPLPPPKTGAPYKPVPPPKPKNYRPPIAPEGISGGGGGGNWGFGVGPPSQPCGDADTTVAAMLKQQPATVPTYQHAKSYSVAGGLDAAGYMPQHNGGKQHSCMHCIAYMILALAVVVCSIAACVL